ncbi:alpha/beta hydrolase [Mangrovibacillus cuniculi]|uniref:Alpha/beta hydrolase n=1 Tax=Mangrovibacillus cuniculi TaxID=2593652 RepID=A0A7S8CCF6_9BACI|nr:alpha/beta hydrolase [Mangrovibacillus cuniculi]QPC47248.1 alpha/beta hydrolase [Mangrovibacillus cuniculi]
MKKSRLLSLFIIGVIFLTLTSFFIWTQMTYKGTENLSAMLEEVPLKENSTYIFTPEKESDIGIIIYPGAKVEPEAYFYLGQELSESGFMVAIPSMPLNLAITNVNKAKGIIDNHESIDQWFIGGHSLGGVAAASFAFEQQDNLKGLILLASYPSGKSDFSNTNFPILSIYGERDGLTTYEEIEKNARLLSKNTIIHEIKGGNHAQFGVYGEQKGDNTAGISVKEQQEEIVSTITSWINEGLGK